MTTVAAVRPHPLAALRRQWRLSALVLAGVVPFAPSLLAMRQFLLADNALGFVPAVPLVSAFIFWQRGHMASPPAKRDLLLDAFFAAPLAVAAVFILYVVPSQLSWYYWLNRVDLLAFPIWMLACAVLFLGYQQVLRTWPAWLFLFLVWPYPMVRLQVSATQPLVDATTWLAARLSAFLALPYDVSGTAFTRSDLPVEEQVTLVVGQLCSGASTMGGLLLGGTAIMLLSRGRVMSRIRWVALAVALGFLANGFRVVALLLAATQDVDFAVNVLHPVLGIVLFLLTLGVMLLLLKPFGLRFAPEAAGRHLAWAPTEGGGRTLRALWVAAPLIALAIGVGVAGAQQYDFIGLGAGAPEVAVDSEKRIIPAVEGWDLGHVTEIGWTDLFGKQSRGDVFTYTKAGVGEAPGQPFVLAQTIIAESKSSLDRYTLEQCIDFHRRKLEGRQAVPLGHGVTGVILHEVYDGVPSSTLYFVFPVSVQGELRHARIALFGDVEAPTWVTAEPPSGGAGSALSNRVGLVLDNALDGLPGNTSERAQVDRGLVDLGTQIVETMVTTGGPAKAVEAS
ncbi:MAG: exosortase/archaeosortase family protein [Dehalococcoidia bacterium]|nr:MAG: exosortase/archaeosortase family protein [Dehalococcoidia bacterium]